MEVLGYIILYFAGVGMGMILNSIWNVTRTAKIPPIENISVSYEDSQAGYFDYSWRNFENINQTNIIDMKNRQPEKDKK